MIPSVSYLVCATERSGSTLLCELLAGTGVAGRPEEFFEVLEATGRPRQPREYFDGVGDPAILDLLPALCEPLPQPPFAERLAGALACGTTPNGVFGAKMMWAYLTGFLAHAPRPEEALGPLRWVHVDRADTLAQAISLWRAIQTSEWRASDGAADRPEPVFHAGAIAHLEGRLREHARCWRAWFAERGIRPLEIAYERFAEDPHTGVRAVLEHIGVPAEGVRIPDPPLRRQADGLSAEWAERYRAAVPA
jgi:LPS sulfotransferase NodH